MYLRCRRRKAESVMSRGGEARGWRVLGECGKVGRGKVLGRREGRILRRGRQVGGGKGGGGEVLIGGRGGGEVLMV